MKNKKILVRRLAIWQDLLLNKYVHLWAPCVTDTVLDYRGSSLSDYVRSEEFFEISKARLSEHEDVYRYYKVDVQALTIQQLLTIPMLPVFAKAIAGRLRKFSLFDEFSNDEIADVMLSSIYRRISQFDPARMVPLEAFLQKTAIWDVRRFFEKERKRRKKFISLDVTNENVHSLNDVLAGAPVQNPFDWHPHIHAALKSSLIKATDIELFRRAVYAGENFTGMAASLGISKGTLSYRLSKIQHRFETRLLKLVKKDFDSARRFDVFADAFKNWLSEEDFLKIFSNNSGVQEI